MKFLTSLLFGELAVALPTLLFTRSPAPVSPLEIRQSCAATCTSACYYESTVEEALQAGCQRYREDDPVSSYPHQYNNYEGFDFPIAGPYQEFPILRSYNNNPYTGGSPGADRVIFNTNCQLAGVITHDGASGDDFVECS
ncbi:Guanyl-specific ribonuclease F1 [Cyphellophora attinorum]|uniref:ribonuclease T1 n=1 Tax=Cyphellophora attinorum TaxID=1664694 RepID=A0A0N1NYH6_9EURO|nr:Guanyl-specific ribonuclease F1 [Phialophora attinorum]KPI37173.1 Guanyl-specific ribonuclease F1 [Phialophora attinorum]